VKKQSGSSEKPGKEAGPVYPVHGLLDIIKGENLELCGG
jgi:hypothetical protein